MSKRKCEDCNGFKEDIKTLQSEVEDLQDTLNRTREQQQEDVEYLIALRNKELECGPGCILDWEWQRAWKGIGANG